MATVDPEFRGRELSHPFELYLAINQIRHRRTEVRSPETNGFCERMHWTIKEEFFSSAFRKTLYESVDQLQADLDRYMEFYNRDRSHSGLPHPRQDSLSGLPRRHSADRSGESRLS